MEYRRLGRTGLDASVIGFGCNRIARDPSREVRREVVATLEQALAHGINLFDTANSYRGSERLLGSVFRSHRHRILLCSKAGYRSWLLLALERALPLPLGSIRRPRPAREPGSASGTAGRDPRRNFEPRYLRLGVEGSLRRLGTDYLDIFYLHSPPPRVVADDRVFETLERLQERGWIRHYGVSFSEHATTDEVVAAMRQPGVSVLQVKVNPLVSVDLERIDAQAHERGIAIVARQPFERGRLFGSAELLDRLAREPRTPAQTLLRSALQRRGVGTVLVGMRTRQHLEENLGALAAPLLGTDELQALYARTRIL